MKNLFLIISLFFISFSYSQDLGMSPLDYPLSEKDSLQWPITYEIEVGVNDLRSLQVKSENFYTKFDYAYFSKFDSIYVTTQRDTIPLYPEYDISLIYPESDQLYEWGLPIYSGNIDVIDSTYNQWISAFEGTLPIKWNLRDYPFDSQKLQIRFVSSSDTSQVLLEESKIFKSDIYTDNINYLIDGYEIKDLLIEKKFKKTSWIEDLPGGTRNVVNSELIFNIIVDRKGAYLYFKLFFGAFLSYIISLLVFFIDKKLFETRITLSLGGIFGAVGNKYFVENSLPELLILTKADLINNLVIVFIIINIFLVIGQSTKNINLRIFENNKNALMLSSIAFIITNIIIILY